MSPYESGPSGAASETGSRSDTSVPRVDLLALTPRERHCYDTGRLFGYVEGHEAGVRYADDRAATLFRSATAIVHAMAGLPEVDPEQARQVAARRERRWSA